MKNIYEISEFYNSKGFGYCFNAKNIATPALTHIAASSSVVNSMNKTKFVEWPVVDNVPLLDNTLYNGVS